jgi:hypothetical protein
LALDKIGVDNAAPVLSAAVAAAIGGDTRRWKSSLVAFRDSVLRRRIGDAKAVTLSRFLPKKLTETSSEV